MNSESFLDVTLNIHPLSFVKSEQRFLTYRDVVCHLSNLTLSPIGNCVMLPLILIIGCICVKHFVCL